MQLFINNYYRKIDGSNMNQRMDQICVLKEIEKYTNGTGEYLTVEWKEDMEFCHKISRYPLEIFVRDFQRLLRYPENSFMDELQAL